MVRRRAPCDPPPGRLCLYQSDFAGKRASKTTLRRACSCDTSLNQESPGGGELFTDRLAIVSVSYPERGAGCAESAVETLPVFGREARAAWFNPQRLSDLFHHHSKGPAPDIFRQPGLAETVATFARSSDRQRIVA